MIEPITAWWILLVPYILQLGIMIKEESENKNRQVIEVIGRLVFYALIFYCMYIIKGAL